MLNSTILPPPFTLEAVSEFPEGDIDQVRVTSAQKVVGNAELCAWLKHLFVFSDADVDHVCLEHECACAHVVCIIEDECLSCKRCARAPAGCLAHTH